MRAIGIIEPGRLKHIPEKYRAQHEFCFHLHDLMASLLVQMEIQKAGHIKFEIESEEDQRLLESGIHILDFLNKSGRSDLERRAVVNHVCNALFSDILHFVYEALRCLEKRKFTVALSLLRKPLKEGMLIAAMMCADEVTFFDRMKNDAKNLLNRNQLDEPAIKNLLESAIAASRASQSYRRMNGRHGMVGQFRQSVFRTPWRLRRRERCRQGSASTRSCGMDRRNGHDRHFRAVRWDDGGSAFALC